MSEPNVSDEGDVSLESLERRLLDRQRCKREDERALEEVRREAAAKARRFEAAIAADEDEIDRLLAELDARYSRMSVSS